MIIEDYIKISLAIQDIETPTVSDILPLYRDLEYSQVLDLLQEYKALDERSDELINRFKIGDIEFGLIPDFDKITTGEFLDLSTYESDLGNIHRLMAILYRPVTSTRRGKYSIEKYEGSDKYKDIMLKVDAKVYTSVIGFFLTLNQVCMKILSTSFQKEVRR